MSSLKSHESTRAEPEKRDGDVDVEEAIVPPVAPEDEEEDQYPDGWKKIFIIMLGVYLAMLLVALDRTILGTAIPQITDEFHSIDDVGWYASAYLLTSCAFQLMYGRIYTFFSAKWVLLGAIGLFELGSVVCGTAPNSTSFIVGRAIAGLGGAGIFSGAIAIMIITVPLHKRPIFQGLFGAVMGIASICGPLLGGTFTSKLTWRWCFYINLPVGAVVVLIILLILKVPPNTNKDTGREQIMKLDPYGTVVFLPCIVSFLLALQWGGNTYAWSSARIIALFVLAAVLFIVFLYIQYRGGDKATIPFHIISQRSIASGAFFSALLPGAMMVIIYYLPIWFQAIKGVSAVDSGIDTLPMVMALVVGTVLGGISTVKIGYYVPALLASTVIMSIGAGLITTLTPTTGSNLWIGFEFVFGFGLGLGMQQSGMAAQVCLAKKDVMTGVAIMFFFQGLGGSIFVSIAQAVFTKSLVKNFASLSSISNLTPAMITNVGATDLRNIVPVQFLPGVLVAYNEALRDVFKVGVGCAAATILAGLTMEWKSVKGVRAKSREAEAKKKAAKEESAAGSVVENADADSQTVIDESPTVVSQEFMKSKE